MTSPAYYPKVSRSPGLLPHEEEFVDWLERFIGQVSQEAHRRVRRFQVMAIAAVLFGLAASTAVLAGAPKWIPASLGFVATAAVGVQLVLHDQRHGVIKHQTAVELQEALRDFRFGMAEAMGAAELRIRFQGFRRRVGEIKKRHGSKAVNVMSEPPPRVTLPR